MEKIKNTAKKDTLICVTLIAFTCIIFIPFLTGHYIADTYGIIERGLEDYSIYNSFTDGRMLMGLLNLLVLKLNMPIIAYVIFTLVIGIIISCMVVILLKNIILKFRPAESKYIEAIVTVICYVTIFNFMYLENLYFIECIVMALSLLLYTLGAYILVDRTKWYFLKSGLCVIIGMLSYQGTIGFFLALVFLFSILENKNKISSLIKDVLLSAVLVVIAGLIDLACIEIFTNQFGTNQGRLNNNIFQNIIIIFMYFPKILTHTCGMFPTNLLIIFLSLLVVLAVIGILQKYKKEAGKGIILYFLLMIFVIASAFSSSVLSSSSFWAARMRFCIGALVGILFLYLYVTTDLFQKKNALTVLSIILLTTYAVCNLYQYVNIINQNKQMNKIEEQECQEIEKNIEEYEEQTGNSITKIARVYSKTHNETLYLPDNPQASTSVLNSTKCWWSVKGTIYFYTGKRLEYVSATTTGVQALTNSGKEFECVGDTLYIFIYQT